MRIFSWNVNGLRAAEKKGFSEWLQRESPDILAVQETKLQEHQLEDSFASVPGWQSYFSHAEKKGYSGTAVYTKQKPEAVSLGIGIDRYDSEGRFVIADYRDFILMNIYFPNGKMNEERLQYKLDFHNDLIVYCQKLRKAGREIIITGDFNIAHNEIDLKNPKANEKFSGFLPIERKWMDRLDELGYIDCFRHLYPDTVKYSWWTYRFNARQNNAGWRIDYHYITPGLLTHLKNAEIHNDVMGSDHCPVSIELDL